MNATDATTKNATTTNRKEHTLPTSIIGDIEIVAGIKVRKLKKKKLVLAPLGKPLGLNIQALPKLGIGVNTVKVTSCVFTSIQRGDIFSEFMGNKLHNESAYDFVQMVKGINPSAGADGNAKANKNSTRILVVEYTAANVAKLWEKIETNTGTKPNSKGIEKVTTQISKPQISSIENLKPCTVGNNKTNFGISKDITKHSTQSDPNSSQCNDQSFETRIVTNSNTIQQATDSIKSINPGTSSKPTNEALRTETGELKTDENTRIGLSNDTFPQWLTEKKSTWNFENRVKKPPHSGSNSVKKFKFESAKSFGLPEGWTVRTQPRSRYTFRSPTGTLYYSKKKVYEFLGMDPDTADMKQGNDTKPAFIRVYDHPTGSNELTKASSNTDKPKAILASTETPPVSIFQNGNGVKVVSSVQHSQIPVEPIKGLVSDKSKNDSSSPSITGQKRNSTGSLSISKPNKRVRKEVESSSNTKSLSDVVDGLSKAREIVLKFGPLPWKGCKMVTGPPGTVSLGAQIQCLPSKFGVGVTAISDNSPLHGKVKVGDIITHFMGMPLHGLEVLEVARLFKSEIKNDRVFQIAPFDFKIDSCPIQDNNSENIKNRLNDNGDVIVEPRTGQTQIENLSLASDTNKIDGIGLRKVIDTVVLEGGDMSKSKNVGTCSVAELTHKDQVSSKVSALAKVAKCSSKENYNVRTGIIPVKENSVDTCNVMEMNDNNCKSKGKMTEDNEALTPINKLHVVAPVQRKDISIEKGTKSITVASDKTLIMHKKTQEIQETNITCESRNAMNVNNIMDNSSSEIECMNSKSLTTDNIGASQVINQVVASRNDKVIRANTDVHKEPLNDNSTLSIIDNNDKTNPVNEHIRTVVSTLSSTTRVDDSKERFHDKKSLGTIENIKHSVDVSAVSTSAINESNTRCEDNGSNKTREAVESLSKSYDIIKCPNELAERKNITLTTHSKDKIIYLTENEGKQNRVDVSTAKDINDKAGADQFRPDKHGNVQASIIKAISAVTQAKDVDHKTESIHKGPQDSAIAPSIDNHVVAVTKVGTVTAEKIVPETKTGTSNNFNRNGNGLRTAAVVEPAEVENISPPININQGDHFTRRKWKKEEDNLIRRLVKVHGTDDWNRIALEVPNKTATQCRFRWINVIHPSILLSGDNDIISTPPVSNGKDSIYNIESRCFKKIILPPFKGPIGMNVQELPSKKGIGIASVKESSPFYGKVHRGDTIVKFMETSLRGISVLQFIQMVRKKENQNRYFLVSTLKTTPTSTPSPRKKVFELPNINLDEDEDNVGGVTATFTTKGIDLAAFGDQKAIRTMPICFAFSPHDAESERIAERKQKRWNDRLQTRG